MNIFLLAMVLGTTNPTRIVALTLLAEARGEGAVGMYAVGCVIRNRARERHISMAAVCLQPKQFSCWNAGHIPDSLLNSKEGELAWKMAKRLMDGTGIDITHGSNHYHATYCAPNWADPTHIVYRYRHHIFYRL